MDFIVSGNEGQAAGIEVKAGLTVKKELFETLEMLIASGSVQCGVIIYNEDKVLPFADKLAALPVGCLF